MSGPMLEVRGLTKWFASRKRGKAPVRAATDVSFEIAAGEILGLVGESGSGKSTIGQTIVRLHDPDAGTVQINGAPFSSLGGQALRGRRNLVQMIFQDPSSSLNPRMRIGQIIDEALRIHAAPGGASGRADRVADLMGLIGLGPAFVQRYPHQLSGGQKQRVGIARALAVEPRLLVADEAVSALDVSIQAQVLNLLLDLRKRLDLTMLFISHDMNVVEYISDRVAVLYLGRIVEIGASADLFRAPRHPYTRALLSAVPNAGRARAGARIILKGDMPNPADPPSGCAFRTRCPFAAPACAAQVPPLVRMSADHHAACLRPEALNAATDSRAVTA